MNKIRVNHHEMNYILITGVWLVVHILFAAVLLMGCYELDDGVLVGWLFLVLGTVLIIVLMIMLDKSKALVTWDEKQIRIRFRRHTDIIEIEQIESVSYTTYREYYGRGGSALRMSVNIKAGDREYSINDGVKDDIIPVLVDSRAAEIPLLRLYNDIRAMRPETDMGYVKSENGGLL